MKNKESERGYLYTLLVSIGIIAIEIADYIKNGDISLLELSGWLMVVILLLQLNIEKKIKLSKYNTNELIALFFYYILRKKPSCSTFIDEDTITYGYGGQKMNEFGIFKYELSDNIKIKDFGTLSWNEYLGRNKQ